MKKLLIFSLSLVIFTATANSPRLEYACMTENMTMIQVLKHGEKHILNLGYSQALTATKQINDDESISFSYDLNELQRTPKLNRSGEIIITNEESEDFIFSLKGTQTETDSDKEISIALKCQKH